MIRILLASLGLSMLTGTVPADAGPYGRWRNGPPDDPGYFSIAVWLQDPSNAERFKAAGINCYVGLWKGPTEDQLAVLKAAGMPVICEQNETGLEHRDDRLIIGWMHGDEPDNAQSLGKGKGYGPPVEPEEIIRHYRRIRKADPTRPILLNLGQGVAWNGWYGRGSRTNKPEDYPEYVKGCDIASFDIYPAVHDHVDVAGKLWFVPRGVERLVEWAGPDRIVWNCIEASRISNVNMKPTPDQIKAEVWMSIIHGSRGLIYFVHQFEPEFVEASLLHDPDLLAAVTEINAQVRELAPVINSPVVADALRIETRPAEAPIAFSARRHEGMIYLFCSAMRDLKSTASFSVTELDDDVDIEVIGETRNLRSIAGRFRDEFKPYEVHLYRMAASRREAAR